MNYHLGWTNHGAQATCRFTVSAFGLPPPGAYAKCSGSRLTLKLRVVQHYRRTLRCDGHLGSQGRSATGSVVASSFLVQEP